MDYFKGITDIEQAKLRYKSLAKQLHPDMGGTTQEFQRMQEEYKSTLLQLRKVSHPVNTEQKQSEEYELLNELEKLARVLIKKQVPQNMLRFTIQSTESPFQKKILNGLVSFLDEL